MLTLSSPGSALHQLMPEVANDVPTIVAPVVQLTLSSTPHFLSAPSSFSIQGLKGEREAMVANQRIPTDLYQRHTRPCSLAPWMSQPCFSPGVPLPPPLSAVRAGLPSLAFVLQENFITVTSRGTRMALKLGCLGFKFPYV